MTQAVKTSYVTPLSPEVRRRHEHIRLGKRVIHFIVQIELLHNGLWHPVVRYDTAHGFAHRDLILRNGSIDKTPLFVQNLNEALDFAESDIRTNWASYAERFKKEIQR